MKTYERARGHHKFMRGEGRKRSKQNHAVRGCMKTAKFISKSTVHLLLTMRSLREDSQE